MCPCIRIGAAALVVTLSGAGGFFLAGVARAESPASQPAGSTAPVSAAPEMSGAKTFTVVNIEYEGSKVWSPGTLIVKKGDKVSVRLINNAPSGDHNWAVEKYLPEGVTVHKGQPEKAEFTADAAGVYRIFCKLHPAHVGGQLLVLE